MQTPDTPIASPTTPPDRPAGSVDLSALHSLLARWADARDRGEPVAADRLTDDPVLRAELARRIAQEEGLVAVAGGPPEATGAPAVPDYEILAEVGHGGMGVVYHARHRTLNRPVALKMILGADRSDPRALIRFLAEAESVAAVAHPHVVRIFDYGEHGGRPFMALEYLPGGTLAGRLRERGRLSPNEAAALVERLARGVQAAHDRGIVHRDLKPANVLFDADGQPKVADFGLAKRGGGDLTQTGTVLGTPAYMSPEQAKGETRFVTPAADVWALGVILYECLTGAKPFDAPDSWAVLKKVVEADPAPARSRVGEVPRDLDLVCRTCLEKDPADRYPTAAGLADDLARFGRGEPVAVRRAGRVERAYKWARRNPAPAAAYALLLLVVVVGSLAGGAVWLWREAEGARVRESQALGLLKEEKDRADDEVYYRRINMAHQDWRDNNVLRSLRELNRANPDRRDWEWRHVAHICSSDLRVLRYTGYVDRLAVSSDGRRVVIPVDGDGMHVWEVATGREQTVYRATVVDNARTVFHPDSRRVISALMDDSVHLWDADTGATIRTWRLGPDNDRTVDRAQSGVAVSPDGTVVAVGAASGAIVLLDPNARAEVGRLDGHPQSTVMQLQFGPDGRRLYSAGYDGTVRVWDVGARTAVGPPRRHQPASPVYALALGPDGHVWSGDDTGRVYRWAPDVPADKEPAAASVWPLHESRVWDIAFAPDGRQFLTGSMDQTARLWDVGTGRAQRTFRGHTEDVMSVWFVGDGSRLMTAGDRTVRVRDATRDPDARVITCPPQGPEGTAPTPALGVAFSPDGRLVAAATAVGLLAWDAQTGRPAGRWGKAGETGRAVAFSPDGRSLADGGLDGQVRVWPVAGGPPRAWAAHQGPVWATTYHPGGDRLASAGEDGRVRVWDPATGREVWSSAPAEGQVMGLAFSPDGRLLAAGGADKAIRLWDAATGATIRTLTGHTHRVSRVAFSRDGTRLASGSHDATTRLWDVATGAEVRKLKGHVHFVDGVGFTPDGRRVADAAGDMTVKLYDTRTGQETLTLKGHTGWVLDLAVSPDGTRLATCSLDGTVRIWDAPADAAVTVPPEADDSYAPGS